MIRAMLTYPEERCQQAAHRRARVCREAPTTVGSRKMSIHFPLLESTVSLFDGESFQIGESAGRQDCVEFRRIWASPLCESLLGSASTSEDA